MGLPDVKIVISGIDKFSKSLGRPMKSLETFGKKTTQIGKSITRNLTLPILGLGTAASIASVKINSSLANVGTLLPGSIDKVTASVKGMKTEIMSMGEDVGLRTGIMSEGLFQVISAFGKNEDTLAKLNINAKAAVAGVSSVKEALDLTSAVTKGFGDETVKTTQKVADLAFKTNELGQTTFKEMAASMGRVTSLSSNLGLTMEEMFGVFATGTGVTGKTSEVSTQLSSVLASLIKPTANMKVAFEKLGVAGGKELVQQKGFQGALNAVVDLTKKYNITLGQLIESKEAINLVFALTGAQANNFTKKLGILNNVTGATERAFKAQSEGINKAGFLWKQFTIQVENTAARIGDKLVPILIDLGQKYVLPLINFIGRLSDTQIKWVIGIGIAITALGPLLLVIGAAPMVIGVLIKSIGFLVVGVKALAATAIFLATNPIGWVIAGIAALTIGIVLLVKHWDKVVIGFKIGWQAIVKYSKIGIDYLIKGLKFVWNMLNPVNDRFETWIKTFKLLARIALPKGMEAKLGISKEADEEQAPTSANQGLGKIGNIGGNKSEFTGTLRIVGAPPKSEIESSKGPIDIEIDSGLQPVGVAF